MSATETISLRGEETRQRLLEAAIRLFAADGYARVTVRDLAREARTNLAAVNYHFGDKFGLYMEVARAAVGIMWSVEDLTGPEASDSPEHKLRHYIRTHVSKLTEFPGGASWVHRLMQHEMAEPTPAAQFIVEHAIRPRMRHLAGVVAEITGWPAGDERVLWGTMMVHTQCLAFLPSSFRTMALSDWMQPPATSIDVMVDHIVAFSMAGLNAMTKVGRRH